MPISLPDRSEALRPLDQLSPREIVAELDRFVVGQAAAKRAVAIALRNRIRRQRLPPEIAQEINPKNILMIGPTGVGKTEIARRLARLSGSPFIKVEASKYTEVGYVGRDVESMIRDLTAVAIEMVRSERRTEVRERAERQAEERLLDLLLPPTRPAEPGQAPTVDPGAGSEGPSTTREKLRQQLRAGALDGRQVELDVRERGGPAVQVLSAQGVEELDVNIKEMFPGLFGGRTQKRTVGVGEARELLRQEEEERLLDKENLARLAIERVESAGIIFLDEIDKIAGREGSHGPDVSREGVQRDILPVVEGTTITTKHGQVRTDHILFIAAGAFHVSKPSDLIPELQGRFPIRVELQALGMEDLVRILSEPENALLKQYQQLMSTEGVALRFTQDAVREIARFATQVNEATEDIGARRLATVMEALLEEVSFEGPDLGTREVTIDAEEVRKRLAPLVNRQDLSRFIL
jgi:ATP-dependent HslUV protease ATP-binding subunit HslU